MAIDRSENQVRTASGLNILAGLWLLASPFLLGYENSALMTSNVITGLIVAVFALIRVATPLRAPSLSWLNAIVGLWAVVSPFALGYVNTSLMTSDVVTGLIVTGLAIWSGSLTSAARSTTKAVHRL